MLLQILQLILCLSILVILHELGHFIPAKWFKIKVEKFYLFFDPFFYLIKKKIGETEYGIGWLPLGGYVKIAGMIDEKIDKEQLKVNPESWEYRSKKPWQKLIIILGGVIVNLFLSWIIFSMIFTFYGYKYQSTQKYQKNGLSFNKAARSTGLKNGDKIILIDGNPIKDEFNVAKIDLILANELLVDRNKKKVKIVLSDDNIRAIFNSSKASLISPSLKEIVIDSVTPNTFAEISGLLKNDTITKINGKNVISFLNFQEELVKLSNKKVQLEIKRNGKLLSLFSNVTSDGMIGFIVKGINPSEYTVVEKITFFESIPRAWNHMITMLTYQVKQFKLIIRPKTEAYKQAMGPIRMFKIFDPSWDWELFWNMTAILSIWLAFVNILPIPGLDGGHAMFIFLEIITGRQIHGNTMEVAQKIGFIIIFSLMIFVFGNDIWHLIQQAMQ